MTVDPGFKYVESFTGGITWFMLESKDIVSTMGSKLKTESNQLVSFDGHSVTFRLSVKEIYFINKNAWETTKIKITF